MNNIIDLKACLIAASLLALTMSASIAQSQATNTKGPDATNVQMVTMGETYCRSIDNEDKTSLDFYTSAADVTAKSGKVIQSHNGGNCCTAAFPWNGSSCQALPVCGAGLEPIGLSCVATEQSCANAGLVLLNGACSVAASTSCYSIQPSGGIYGSNKTANYLDFNPTAWTFPVTSYIPGASTAISTGTQPTGGWFPSSYTNADYNHPYSFDVIINGVQHITDAKYSPSVWYSINVERKINNNNAITAPSGPNGSAAEIYINDQLAGKTVYGPGGTTGTDIVPNTIKSKLKEGKNKITFFLKGSVVGESQDGWTFYWQSRYTADLILFGSRCN